MSVQRETGSVYPKFVNWRVSLKSAEDVPPESSAENIEHDPLNALKDHMNSRHHRRW